jgi:hypothetical protein
MVVNLIKEGGGKDSVVYNWVSSNPAHAARNATIELQFYEGADGPGACGFLTSDALATFDDRQVTIGLQPIPLACN